MTLPPALQFGAIPWALLQRLFVVVTLLAGAAVALRLEGGRVRDPLHRWFVRLPWKTLVTVCVLLAFYLYVPSPLPRLFVVVALLAGAAVALRLEDWSIFDPIHERFVLGVPWGSLVTVCGVLAVYLFVQGGILHWRRPLVIPFRAWSYFEPLGMLVGGFAHAGPGHLLGNLFGAITLAPIVEYVVGHYPPDDPAPPSEDPTLRDRLRALRRRPLARALVLFPLGVGVVGVALTMFTVGAVIGFSGVVFAFAGFALVRYPLGTVLALVASDLLNQTYRALQNPTITRSGSARFVTPWWADIAIQGHAIGLLAGVVLGALLVRRRGDALPSPARLWVGGLLIASMQSLWAVYWYRGGTEYVLFRALGLGLVALAATVVVVAVAGPDRSPFGIGDDTASDDPADDDPPYGSNAGDEPTRLRDLSIRQVGMVVLVLTAAVLSGPAVAVNLVTAEGDLPGEPETVRGYEVTYAEGVQNGMVSAIPITAFGETTQVTTSGVIVSNPEREIWQTVIPKGQLATNGRATVVVGGVGWRETVTVVRRGWTAVGGGTAYAVALGDSGNRRTVFASERARAEPRIAGQNVSVGAENGSFSLFVNRGNDTVRRPLPGANETVSVGDVTYLRRGNSVVAVRGETRVTMFRAESYS